MANERKRRPVKPKAPRPELPEVVYTQPQTLGRKKLIMRLLTVAAVVAALFVGFSLFFQVDTIQVSGAKQYTSWTVVEASGIQEGDSLLALGKGKACGKIVEALPYVKVVRVGIRLPGTVNIYVEEVEVVYSIRDLGDNWWLMSGGGRLVEKVSASTAAKHTMIEGVRVSDPKVGAEAKVVLPEELPTGDETDETQTVITDQDRLQSALEIIGRLEANEVLGQITSIDVEDMTAIRLMYGSRYQVELGGPEQISRKVDMMAQTVKQMGSHQSGILDITFADGQELVIYRPFQ